MNFSIFSRVGKSISEALSNGGKFSRLPSPLASMKEWSFIQFDCSVPRWGIVAGLGAAQSLEKAKVIAFFEFLERKAAFDHTERAGLRSSSGIASHKFMLLAKHSARTELIERDAFLMHWYTSSPFKHLDSSLLGGLQTCLDELLRQGTEVILGETVLGVLPVRVAILKIASGGFCVGTSCGKGLKGDLRKAFIEAVINLRFGDYGHSKENLVAAIDFERSPTLAAHRAYWLYKASLPDWVNISSSGVSNQNVFDPKVHFKILEKRPFPIVYAYSPEMLSLDVGYPKEHILTSVSRRIPSTTVTSDQPHPLF